MSIVPCHWQKGDRATVTRDGETMIGVIDSISETCACLKLNDWRNIFVSRDELELVPHDAEIVVNAHGIRCLAPSSPTPTEVVEDIVATGQLDELLDAPIEQVDSELREMGVDPEKLAGRGLAFVRQVKSEDYAEFVSSKLTTTPATGLAVVPELNASLFPFQRDLVAWALRRGRAALFADTGLGKTAMQLEWARCVATHAFGDVLVLAPLAVAAQTAREGERLGIPVKVCRDATDVEPGVNVTNYDRLHRFDPSKFVGVVLDESSIIKHHDAKTLARLLEAFRDTPFKLCASATPSPNDYTELGTHAEFLGACSRVEMLAEFFVHDGGSTQDWRLKGHARAAFWRWMSTWAALLRKPSDLGYDDGGYDLPPLNVHQHTIAADPEQVKAQGLLFAEPARTLTERRNARKSTITARVEQCAALVRGSSEPWIIWCELNAEAEALVEAIGPSAVEIRGSDEPLLKEGRLRAFSDGEIRVLVTKPKIAGFGLNWQHCARMAFVGVNDSWESYYQAIRRCWRFGQRRAVDVHIFASELEGEVAKNLQRKERDALAMAEQLSAETRDAVRAEVRGLVRSTNDYRPAVAMTVPAWMKGDAA